MNLIEALAAPRQLSPLSSPDLRYVQAAAQRVLKQWPDVMVSPSTKDREALAQKLRQRIDQNDWEDTRLSFVVAASSAVFDEERRERSDLTHTRQFLYDEITASSSKTFLSQLLRIYLDSYTPSSAHTKALAAALRASEPRMSQASQLLVADLPELVDPLAGPDRLAKRMLNMSDPHSELTRLGLRAPHGDGFMALAHLSFTASVKTRLSNRDWIDWYLRWLRPPDREVGITGEGAKASIEALIHPWLEKAPEDELRSFLVETLIEFYGDPRIKGGGEWSSINERSMTVIHRWLTREDMRFFTGVVDATQKDPMWPPRRNLWLKLYDEGRIDAAWAALSTPAFKYARQHLMRQDAKNAYTRVGYQQARQNTSLLIMKIGNKIMVDGCHSYRTHVFDSADPMAPKLFEEGYDCDEIMRASDAGRSSASKPHHSISSWSRWVRDMINADVQWSEQSRPYRKVLRPAAPRSRSLSPNSDRPKSRPDGHAGMVSTVGKPESKLNDFLAQPPGSKPAKLTRSATKPSGATPSQPIPGNNHRRAIKQIGYGSLTDRLMAYGPGGADAVLSFFDQPDRRQARAALSPKSREALEWLTVEKGDLPNSLRNALEFLLNKLKKSGIDLDGLFASTTQFSPTLNHAVQPESGSEKFTGPAIKPLPSLSGSPEDRLNLLRGNLDDLEDLEIQQNGQPRAVFKEAARKLRDRSPDLRPAEIAELQSLYEQVRQSQKDGRQ